MKTPLRRWSLLSLLFLWLLVPLSAPYSTNAQAQKGPAPLFAGGSTTPPNDGLPQYICAADAFASYYTLQQIQSSGLDVKYKFHLGIVPFLLDGSGGKYDL